MATNTLSTLTLSQPNGINTISASSGLYTLSTSANHNSLHVTGDAAVEGTLKVNGVDVAQTLRAIQDRLAILVPDPKN